MNEIEAIFECLSRQRFPLNDEIKLHQAIAAEFDAAGISYEREVRLDSKNRIDFMCGDIGLECKIKGGKMSIFRQIERYAEFDEIKKLILVTNVPTGFPPEVNGKPVYILNLAKAWL
jgi:hypothetical protein